jgi:metallo-beta-lactamase class B
MKIQVLFLVATAALAQNAPDHPSVEVKGKTFTPRSILSRNMGTEEDQTTAFPPHQVAGNIYYVGTRTLSAFLIVTPAGNILMNSTYERNVGTIRKSIEQLGFKFADTKILIGNHAHNDHMEGDAMVKELTGAQVIVMAEDQPPILAMKPGGKPHPLDRVIHDGDTIMLGNVTLTAHLTAGHTPGATTWTMPVEENGKKYQVVFFSSLRSPGVLTPPVIEQMTRAFAAVRRLPCDIPLGDHPAEYGMTEKFAKRKLGGVNPFIDPAGCFTEADVQESMFKAILAEQQASGAH